MDKSLSSELARGAVKSAGSLVALLLLVVYGIPLAIGLAILIVASLTGLLLGIGINLFVSPGLVLANSLVLASAVAAGYVIMHPVRIWRWLRSF